MKTETILNAMVETNRRKSIDDYLGRTDKYSQRLERQYAAFRARILLICENGEVKVLDFGISKTGSKIIKESK